MDTSQEEELGQIIESIQLSSLSDLDKNIWFNAIKELPPEAYAAILGIVADPQALADANQLIARKIVALQSSKGELWDQIIKEESDYIESHV